MKKKLFTFALDVYKRQVREYYYAVAPSGAIYRLNPVDGTWEPAGRG